MLDPTLLLTAEEWREAEEPLDLKKPFIFVYMLGASSRMLRFATTLKKKTGMQLVFCPSRWASRRSVDGIPSFPRPSGSG
ncbi:MAG: hypothetical protein ACLTV6_15235 [Christensenellales bacterium]